MYIYIYGSGTKQGGILSPDFFSVYIDDLIRLLEGKGLGCHIGTKFLACFLFADDMALISPSRGGMQKMIDICVRYCNEFCLSFNVKKTKTMIFGKLFSSTDQSEPLFINEESIEFVTKWRYLGFPFSYSFWS